ncbi:MAG: type VI secretion system baseplate subunit TssK [Geminicoccaceae bacterium]
MVHANKVMWSEGMFLRPQHFQQQDRYIDSLVRGATDDLVVHGFGFRSLRLNVALLEQGKLAIAEADGIFPDGTPVHIPETADQPEPLALDVDSQPGTIYLALPHHQPGSAEFDQLGALPSGARYAADRIEVADAVVGGGTARDALEVARPQLKLLPETATRDAYSCLGVARVREIKADGGLVLDADYIPPCLRFDASNVLEEFLTELVGRLDSAADDLTGWVAGRRDHGVAEVRDLLLLQLINGAKPLIDHWLAQGSIHPERLYAALVSLSGELATFCRDDRRPIAFEPYRHEDCRLAYLPLIAELRRELSIRTERKAVPVPLREHRSGVRTTDVQDQRLFSEATFILAVGASCSGEQIRQDFPLHVTIGPINEFQDLIDGAIRGIPVTPLPLMPPQLPHHAGRIYFELDRANTYWSKLPTSGGMAILLAGDNFPDLQIECWAIRD